MKNIQLIVRLILLKIIRFTLCFSLLTLSFIEVFTFHSLQAQSPHALSYQAIIRDAGGNLVKEQTVGMQISILQGSESGTAVYRETHQKPTNANGLVSLEIGNGSPVQGNFTDIDWADGPYFVKTETDPNGGNNYSIVGVSQLHSVPYAMYALSGGEPGPQGPPGDDGQDGMMPDGESPGVVPFWDGTQWVVNENILSNTGESIGVGTSQTDASALLQLESTSKGLLIPRMTTEERDALANPATGLMIYNSSQNCFNYFTGVIWMQYCGNTAGGGSSDQNQYLPIQGTTDRDLYVGGIVTDHEGNILVAGFFNDNAQFGEYALEAPNALKVFIVKYNSKHEVLWARTETSISADYTESTGNGIAVDPSGNIVVTGKFYGSIAFGSHPLTSSAGNYDAFTVKYDAEGEVIWARSGTGNGDVAAEDIVIDQDGNIYIVGRFSQTVTFGTESLTTPAGVDAFLVKYDPDGNVVWARNSVGPGNTYGRALSVDHDGNLLMAGFFTNTVFFQNQSLTSGGGTFINNTFTVKYSSDGNVQWLRGGISSSVSEPNSIATDGENSVYVAGYFSEAATFDSQEITANTSGRKGYVVKYDAEGNLLWAQNASGEFDLNITAIAADPKGDIVIAGEFFTNLSIGGLSVQAPRTPDSFGNQDLFVAKLDASGKALWLKRGGGFYSQTLGRAITTDKNGDVLVAGEFDQTVSFGSQSITSSSIYSKELFVVRYTPSGMVNTSTASTGVSGNIDLDNDPTNELITSFLLMGRSLTVSDAGGDRNVDLTPVATKWSGGGANIWRTEGNVGIGTFNPGERLHVSGNILTSGDIHLTGFNRTIFNRTNHYLAFGTNNTERMRIANAGRVGIGETSPTDRLSVSSNEDENALRVVVGTTTRLRVYSTGGVGVGSNMQSSPPPAGFLAVSQGVTIGTTDPNNFQLRLTQDLAAKPTSSSWTIFSDERLKKNVQTIENPLEKVLSLRGITYQWIDPATQGDMKGTYTGMIAQEVEKVFPEWIREDEKGFKTLTVIGFEGIMVEALRELRAEKDAEIEELKDRLETLEALVHRMLITGSAGEK